MAFTRRGLLPSQSAATPPPVRQEPPQDSRPLDISSSSGSGSNHSISETWIRDVGGRNVDPDDVAEVVAALTDMVKGMGQDDDGDSGGR